MPAITRPRVLLLLVLVALGTSRPAAAITADEFQLRSGADLVALCATPPTDPLYTAAIHMCHGFGAGAFQTMMALTGHEGLDPLVCPPQPSPSRNETVTRFLEWAKRNPQHSIEPAVETVARFFLTTFPCRPK